MQTRLLEVRILSVLLGLCLTATFPETQFKFNGCRLHLQPARIRER